MSKMQTLEQAVRGGASASRLRRQRGYRWEDTITKRFNAAGWHAFRLGSPSIALPDVIAVGSDTIYAIEAKSGTSTLLYVPSEQVTRCIEWAGIFGLYNSKIALAFKFLSKRRRGCGVYEGRELREFFVEWGPGMPAADCVCTYEGAAYVREDGKRTARLGRCTMPF